MHRQAQGALSNLCEFLGVQKWGVPWTRLLLHDVYVRTQMTFGAALWACRTLAQGLQLGAGHCNALTPLMLLHQRGLRMLMGLPGDTRLEVIFTVAARFPLQVMVAKATWRYY